MRSAPAAAGRDAALVEAMQEQVGILGEQVSRLARQNKQLIELNRGLVDRLGSRAKTGESMSSPQENIAKSAGEPTAKSPHLKGECAKCAALSAELSALQRVVRTKEEQLDDEHAIVIKQQDELAEAKIQAEQAQRLISKLQQIPAPSKRRVVDKLNSDIKEHSKNGAVNSEIIAQKPTEHHKMASPIRESSEIAAEDDHSNDFAEKIREIREEKRQKAAESPIMREFEIKERLSLPANASRKLPTVPQVRALLSSFTNDYKAEARKHIKPCVIRAILASLECETVLGYRANSFEVMQEWIEVNYDEEVEGELKRLLSRKLRYQSIDIPRTGELALQQYATDINDSLIQLFITSALHYVLLDGEEITVGQEEQWWLDGERVM